MTRFILLLLIFLPAIAFSQRKVEAEKIHATETFSIRKGINRHDFTGATDTIDSGSTHAQIPTAKSVYDLLSGLGGGSGSGGHVISGNGTPVAAKDTLNYVNNDIQFTVSNSSTRTNVTATIAADSVNATHIAANAVGSAEIAADAVGSSEIAADAVGNSELAANAVDSSNVINGGLSVLDLGQHGASSGQVLKWNGTQWAPANDAGGSGGDDWGVQVAEVDGTTITGDGTSGDPLTVPNGGIGSAQIATGAVGSDEIVNGGVALADLASNSVDSNKVINGGLSVLDLGQHGASSGQTLKWNGTQWAPANDTDTNTDAQTLSWNGTTEEVSISNGNTVDLGLDAKYLPLSADNITADQIAYGTGTGITSSHQLRVNTSSSTFSEVPRILLSGSNTTNVSGLIIDSIPTNGLGIGVASNENSAGAFTAIRADRSGGGAGDIYSTVRQLSANSSADAVQQVYVSSTSGGDPIVQFLISTAGVNLYMDNSDSDIWKVDYDITGDGTDYAIGVDNSNRVRVGALVLNNAISATLSTNQNNYTPTGISQSSFLKLNITADISITGISGAQIDGKLLFIENTGTSTLSLPSESSSSFAAQRFSFAADIDIAPGEGILLSYDNTAQRWRCVGKNTADNWGVQVAEVDGTTITGDGTSGDPLTVPNGGIGSAQIATGAVGSDEIVNGGVALADLASNSVDSNKVINGGLSVLDLGQHGASSGQVLKWNGTQWAPANDTGGSGGDDWGVQVAEVDGTTITGDGTSGDPLTVPNGGIGSAQIATGAVGSDEIVNGGVALADLASNSVDSNKVINGGLSVLDLGQHGASSGQTLKWNGTQWAPATDNNSGGTVTSLAYTAGNGITISGTTPATSTATWTFSADTTVLATVADANAAQQRAWAKTTIGSPNYHPLFSDLVFHNGTVSIKEDTLHHWYHSGGYTDSQVGLYIKHAPTGTSQAPGIHIRNYGPGTGNTNQNTMMMDMELDSFSAPQSVPFTMNMNYVDTASTAGDNTVWNMGLNLNKQGSSYRAGQPSCLLQFESKYAANTSSDQEMWFGFNPTSSGTFRPIYMTANRTDGSGSVLSLSGNSIFFGNGAAGQTKGTWSNDELTISTPATNTTQYITLKGSGTGSSVLRMRRPGDGLNYNMLSIANSTTYAQLSDSYLDIKLGADVFSLDHANYGNAIISARYNSGSPNDTLDFGHYPGFGENYISHSNYRFTLSDGAAVYFGVYGNTISNYGALGQTNANDIFIHTGKAITTTEVAFGIDRSTGNVGISKVISDIDSDAALQVGGKVQVDDFSGTGAQLVARTSTNTLSDLIVGVGLAISGDSLKSTVTGGVSDHGGLTGLSDDDHTQYALLAGRSGGQSLTGGTASGNNLTLSATSNATKGSVLIGTDGSKTVVGTSLYYRGDLAPSALSSNTDDWNPSGLDTAQTLRISASSAVNLTGIQGGADGRILYIFNIGEYAITLKDNVTSTSAYRFEFDADVQLGPTQGIILRYDATASKWRLAGSAAGARLVAPPTVEDIETSAFTALKFIINQVDCSGGTVTVTPPASPVIGDRFSITDATASAGTNNVTIDFDTANQNLYGSEQNYILNVNGGYVEFIYMGATTGWIATK